MRRTLTSARGAVRAALAMLALVAAAGCSDLTDPADRPLVQRARMVVTTAGGETTTYTVTAAGGNAPTPLVLEPGTNRVEVSWLDASGATVPTNGYGLVITRLSSGIVFNANGLTRGTLEATGAARRAFGELRLRDAGSGDDAFAADLEIEVR